LYPVMNVVAKAFSDKTEVAAGHVQSIWPVKPTLASFAYVLNSPRFIIAIKNTFFITIVATALQLMLTIVVAYAVSRKDFPFGRTIMFAYIFTMMFNGGLIPTYLAIRDIGLYNSLWAIIIPSLVNTYYLILMRNFFAGLPQEMEEAAMIDGAGQLLYLVKIMVPLSLPSLATITLFCAVDAWNCYYSAIIYLSSRDLVLLQVYLREVLMSIQTTEVSTLGDSLLEGLPAECIQCACVVACALPITLVYPFLQKYYVQGMTLGAVKG
nr:carbohydrate ABC transporter permease [Clostridia bacterium]